jgi:hypothetical protein
MMKSLKFVRFTTTRGHGKLQCSAILPFDFIISADILSKARTNKMDGDCIFDSADTNRTLYLNRCKFPTVK